MGNDQPRKKKHHEYSIADRIVRTRGFCSSNDKVVLLALETFADFGTGENAYPGILRLRERADLPRRTVERALQRLEGDGWLEARRRHRRSTIFRIRTERLFGGPEYRGAKPFDRTKGFGRHRGGQNDEILAAKSAALTAKSAPVDRHGGVPPVISTSDPDLRAAPLRGGTHTPEPNTTSEVGGERSPAFRQSACLTKKQGLRPNSLTAQNPKANFRVLVRLAHECFDDMGDRANEADLNDALKYRCTELKIPYYPPVDLVGRALDGARHQRAHRRPG